MAVNRSCRVSVGVPQAFAHRGKRHAIGKQLATVRVPERVQADAFQTNPLGQQASLRCNRGGLKVVAFQVTKDKVKIAPVVWAKHAAVLSLAFAVGFEHLDG